MWSDVAGESERTTVEEVKPVVSTGVGVGVGDDDRPLEDRVADGALRHVMANLTGLRLLLLPLTLAVAVATRNHVDSARLTVWILIALEVNIAIVAACSRFRKSGPLDRIDVALAAIAHAGVGVLAGVGLWVAGGARDMMLLFTLISAVSCAAGGAACAGRRDIYLAYIAPIVVLTPWALWASGDSLMRSVAVLYLVWGMSQVVLHQKFSHSVRALLRHQFDSETVAARMSRDREELSRAYEQLSISNDQLAHLASHDPLTGLLNRRGTIEQLDLALASATPATPVAVLYLDLDRFKAVNDLLGHRGGDDFISTLADRMVQAIDDDCLAGRIGGDEFVVVLPGHCADQADRVAQQLVNWMAQPVRAEGRSVPSSVSLGVAVAPQHGTSATDLMRNANTALYRAKHAGRNRVEHFEPHMQVQLQTVLDQEDALRRALDNGEILPFFQPEIDAVTGAVTGAELLARWLRPDGTTVPASEFIDLARKASLLERLTERVLAQARPDMRRLIALGLPAGFRFRVNLGPGSTGHSRPNDLIDELLRGIDPSMVTVDVREASVVSNLSSAATALSSFRAAGGKVCLDDFVDGVSSLTILRRLPIDEVRIDRQAIDSIAAHPHDRAIVRSIITMVLEIGLGISAESVETVAEADALVALGCARQQGHLYAPALPAQQFESFLLQQQAASYAAARQELD
jgi:diguanylate cyclase (GGDEF)-like protein